MVRIHVDGVDAGSFDKNFLSSYILAYHNLYPYAEITIGTTKDLKKVVFHDTPKPSGDSGLETSGNISRGDGMLRKRSRITA